MSIAAAERPDLKQAFDRDGFVYPLRAMSSEDAAEYRAQLEAYEAAADTSEKRNVLRRYPNLVLPWVDEITRLPSITDAAAEILGPDLLVLDPPFFIKEPNTTSYVSWHQDLHYWGLEGEDEVTAWVALSPATRKSGCMKFVAGSHTSKVEHTDTFAADNLLTRGQEIAVDVDEAEATYGELDTGQFSLHHGRVIHGSSPNETDERRIGLAIRYVPTRMSQAPGGKMAAMLVRGEDTYGNFRLCNRPSGNMNEADFAHWREIAGARNAVLMGDKKS